MPRFHLLLPLLATSLLAQVPDASFFETKIRPVLATKCYGCHSSKLKAPMGGLILDTKAGMQKGGALGPILVPGKPGESQLVKALRFTDPQLQMPPTGKLPDTVIADFEQWIASGAVDPRKDAPTTASTPAPLRGMPIEQGRKWWAFQPVQEIPAPAVKDTAWAKTKIDAFILAKLEEKGLTPSPAADARTLVQRAYIDLVGYKPSYDETEQFVNDKSPDAYEKLVDRLLASPHYGERWGRHWMDVARFAEDNPTSEATNPPYPFAWRYRDWVIESMNKDVPYDRFVKLQLAADLMKETSREDMRALGYLGAAPVYHKDLRLSADVIGGFLTDDWDERVDAVTRGLMGLTVACARCHDHKFDPILTKDYYGLVGVFASTMRAERPMFEIDPKIENRYLWMQNRLFDLHYSANLLTGEASTVENAAPRVAKWKAEIQDLKTESKALEDQYPKLVKSLEKYFVFPPPKPAAPKPPVPKATPAGAAVNPMVEARRRPRGSTEPFMNAVFEAAQYVDGSDANYTFINYKQGEARDFPVLLHGNVATPGDVVPRHFLTVLSNGDSTFKNGSGRLELAGRIFSDAAPLTARVIVNRVWDWHFGRPLAATTSDFGTQGEKPTHPQLLDDLAARFIAHGYSLKWLNREMMLTSAYRQASRPRADAEKIDQTNTFLWRMNPRRLDVESYRDSLLRAAGKLSDRMYGVSEDVDSDKSVRRTVYSRVSRGRLSNLFLLYDFPDPSQTAPGRDLTISSLQQLFIMNSPFMREEGRALAESVAEEADNSAKVHGLYRKILSRDPSSREMDLALSYLSEGTVEQYSHILLSTNEVIFWP
ncbi:MAG: PSD1 and planctomycete cytochrome C domain-containing protein [Bryobacteraceae bacterium]